MTIEFHCSNCNKLLRTADDRAGARAKCPDCGTAITVPGGAGGDFDLGEYDDYEAGGGDQFDAAFGQPARSPSRRPASAATKNCPMCGAEIRAAAAKCRYCGEMLGEPAGGGRRRRGSRYEEARGRVQGPAIALMIIAGLALAISVLRMILVATGAIGPRNLQQFGPMVPMGFLLLIYVVQGIASLVIVLGAWQMRGLRSYGLAMTGSILAVIPLLTDVCCLLSMPFGIWSIVVLNDDNVKNAFR
jgi:predicted RNA-binding Zn-ribbon protein involved in translation (DUF1610 family)